MGKEAQDVAPTWEAERVAVITRLLNVEKRLEALTVMLIEEGIISRDHLQKVFNLVEECTQIQEKEQLTGEEAYLKRSKAYKRIFKAKSKK